MNTEYGISSSPTDALFFMRHYICKRKNCHYMQRIRVFGCISFFVSNFYRDGGIHDVHSSGDGLSSFSFGADSSLPFLRPTAKSTAQPPACSLESGNQLNPCPHLAQNTI